MFALVPSEWQAAVVGQRALIVNGPSPRLLSRRCLDHTHTLTRANGEYGVQREPLSELSTTSDILARTVADYVTEGELPPLDTTPPSPPA